MTRHLIAALGIVALSAAALGEQAHAGGTPRPPHDYGYEDADAYPPSPAAAWAACAPDVRRYCPNVLPGGGRILSCLAGNKDRLRRPCHDTLVRAWLYYRR